MAIPASILYVFFISRVDRLIIRIDALAQEVVNLISAEELQERSGRGAKRAAPREPMPPAVKNDANPPYPARLGNIQTVQRSRKCP